MFDIGVYFTALGVALALGLIGWLVSIPLKNVSFVDSMWSMFFLVMGLVYLVSAPEQSSRAWLVFSLTAIWAIRLAVHIARRNHGAEEDHRYQAIRANNQPGFWWKSIYIVFGLQAVLAWLISMPLLAASSPAPLGLLDLLALSLWLTGFAFEAIGDKQLADFKSDPNNRGKVLDQGLWRYTRHPNYFGEACIWWGFYLFAVSAGGWWTLLSPVLITFLLLRVSGVALLEKDIGERRPGYRDYVQRTNAFIPGPPKKA